MKKITNTLILLCTLSAQAYAAPIDLRTWTGTSGGDWDVSGDGSSVLQKINGDPTYFLSDENYINKQFEGKFAVETAGDDDFIGFVFGYENSNDYLLFDWKQADQYFNGGTAREGFTLSRISGTNVDLWNHRGSDLEVLASDYGSTKGWADNTTYDFTLDFSDSRIIIDIDGTNIFDVSGSFDDGKFGFYNYSQSEVRYQGFEETVSPTFVSEPTSLAIFAAGILGFASYRRKKQ